MRNKALIEIRKREALIRAEIEAQLGLKRAEIRDRMQNLSAKMDNFKETANKKSKRGILFPDKTIPIKKIINRTGTRYFRYLLKLLE